MSDMPDVAEVLRLLNKRLDSQQAQIENLQQQIRFTNERVNNLNDQLRLERMRSVFSRRF